MPTWHVAWDYYKADCYSPVGLVVRLVGRFVVI